MAEWQKKRNPEDVPTPIAVAVSDFCRRAKAPATAVDVREALAFLSDDEDFRVRQLTDREPDAAPLGPYAVIDVLGGTTAQMASLREGCGYYEVVRQLVAERRGAASAQPSPGPAPLHTVPAEALDVEIRDRPPSSPAPTFARAEKGTEKGKDKPTVQERIAPRKREAAPAQEEAAEGFESGLPKRNLPLPRGRYTRLAAPKRPAEELFEEASREILESLLEQHPERMSLLRALGEQFAGRGGAPLALGDVEPALEHHKLMDKLQRKEREVILSSYAEHKGANGRVAWALGMSPAELDKLVRGIGLLQEVTESRERFKREALSPQNLTYRLDLLGRTKYLSDLGIQKRFMDSLTRDLRSMLDGVAAGAPDLAELADRLGRKHGAPSELVTRAMDRLGLAEEFRKRLSSESASYSPHD